MTRNRTSAALLPTLIVALALPCGAEAGFYVGGGAAISYAPDQRLGDARLDFDVDLPSKLLYAGYRFVTGWQVELEASHVSNAIEIVPLADGGFIETTSSDRAKSQALAVNFIYGTPVGSSFTPFFGIGAGYERIDYRINDKNSGQRLLDDVTDVASARLLAGFALHVWRGLDIVADYRFRQSGVLSLHDSNNQRRRTNHAVHSVGAGARYRFGASDRVAASWQRRPRKPAAYLEVWGGGAYPHDNEIENSIVNFDAFDLGPAAALAVGRRTQNGLSYELELGGYRNEVDVIDFGPSAGESAATGRVRATALMANLVYEFPFPVRPYLGLGVGASKLRYRVRLDGDPFVDAADTAIALQAMAGLATDLTPRLGFALEFRGWFAPSVKLSGANGPIEVFHAVYATGLSLTYQLD